MTIRKPLTYGEPAWPGELRQAYQPVTEEFFSKLPEGHRYYDLVKGNLILKNYMGAENLPQPEQPVTAELFLQIPEGPPYYELIAGTIVMSPPPTFLHQNILGSLLQSLGNYLDDNPLGILSFAPCAVLLTNEGIFEPDLFFVRKGNPKVVIDDIIKGPPDLVVEILSPSNFRKDRNVKRPAYARAGVEEMWIVDPETKQIEVYPLAQGIEIAPTIIHEPEPFSPALFPGLTIETTRLFKLLT